MAPSRTTLPDGFDRHIERLSEQISLGQRREFRELANVVGSGIGPKYVNGERTDQCALIIFVTSKQPEHRLDTGDILPESIVTDTGIEVAIDVEEAPGGFRATSVSDPGQASPLRTERYRPMPGGVPISRESGNAGTSSGLMYTGAGDPVVLTPRHIATRNAENSTGHPMYQPARLFDSSSEAFGTTRTHAPWWPGDTTRTSEIDASLIDVDPADVSGEYLGTDRSATSGGRMDMDRRVVHVAYPTGIRSGMPRARDVEGRVDYTSFGGFVEYEGLESIDGISAPGSSGAMNVQIDYRTGEMTIVGMLVAATTVDGVQTRALHIPWRTIERHFTNLTPA